MWNGLNTIAGHKESKAGPRVGQADRETSRVPNGAGKDICERLASSGECLGTGVRGKWPCRHSRLGALLSCSQDGSTINWHLEHHCVSPGQVCAQHSE